MNNDKPFDSQIIFTIGHSNHGLEKFLTLLKDNKIEVLVDIRSKPYSRFASHFNKAALNDSFYAYGIKYFFLGDKLGGRPNDKKFYDSEGNVLYSRIAETPEFHEGIERLIKGIKDYRLALMCSEENPENCHRYLLVGRFLEKRGITVIHIRGDERKQPKGEFTHEANRSSEMQQNLFQCETLGSSHRPTSYPFH